MVWALSLPVKVWWEGRECGSDHRECRSDGRGGSVGVIRGSVGVMGGGKCGCDGKGV